MDKYIEQLLADIACATENVSLPFAEKQLELHDWISDEEESRITSVRELEEWTGIKQEQLPPATMLSEEHVSVLLAALKIMLNVYNWSFVLQTKVPERIQYHTIQQNFKQQAKVKRWHHGFFEVCHQDSAHGKCALGDYCQCAFYSELFAGFKDVELSPEEERAMQLECEIKYLQRKYGEDWMKYYPYHLDASYDDKKGNSDDYGLGENDNDDWWRK